MILYRLEGDEWLLVVNAANAEKMWSLLERSAAANVRLAIATASAARPDGTRGAFAEGALIAIQGPRSVDIRGASC